MRSQEAGLAASQEASAQSLAWVTGAVWVWGLMGPHCCISEGSYCRALCTWDTSPLLTFSYFLRMKTKGRKEQWGQRVPSSHALALPWLLLQPRLFRASSWVLTSLHSCQARAPRFGASP